MALRAGRGGEIQDTETVEVRYQDAGHPNIGQLERFDFD